MNIQVLKKQIKTEVIEITIYKAEGHCSGQKFQGTTFAEANQQLSIWALSAPTMGYDKCDFKVVWSDDTIYKGRYDLKHHNIEKPNLQDHIKSFCNYMVNKEPDKNFYKDHINFAKHVLDKCDI